MALQSLVFNQDPFCYGLNEFNYAVRGEDKQWDIHGSSGNTGGEGTEAPVASLGQRKRRRSSSLKNEEEVAKRRMSHIAVERNRRRLMNEYLAVIRSLMPMSYALRGDQASIVGGAINYVKELQQLTQSLEAHKTITTNNKSLSSPFSDLFSFPQSSIYKTSMAEKRSDIADVEVTMIENHANVKIQLTRQPKQLTKMVVGFCSLCLNILHINVTALEHTVLYTFSVKVETECQVITVNELAAAIYEMLCRIQEETDVS